MSFAELKDKTVDELRHELIELRQEQLKLRMQKNAGEAAPKTHLHKEVRRNIARVRTLLKQREQSS